MSLGFPLGTTTSYPPLRADIIGEKGALRRPRAYISPRISGVHTWSLRGKSSSATPRVVKRRSSVGIRRVKKVRHADDAPHKGKVAGEDEIARTIGRAQETFCAVKHAGTIRVNSDPSGN